MLCTLVVCISAAAILSAGLYLRMMGWETTRRTRAVRLTFWTIKTLNWRYFLLWFLMKRIPLLTTYLPQHRNVQTYDAINFVFENTTYDLIFLWHFLWGFIFQRSTCFLLDLVILVVEFCLRNYTLFISLYNVHQKLNIIIHLQQEFVKKAHSYSDEEKYTTSMNFLHKKSRNMFKCSS